MAPSTRTTVGLSMPASTATLRAPSNSASQIFSCQVLATMASVKPDAFSSGRTGTPAPPLNALRPGRSQGPAEFPGHRFVVIVETGQVVAHPVTLGHQVADVLRIGAHRQRDTLDDVQPVAVQADTLGRVVGQQPHRP